MCFLKKPFQVFLWVLGGLFRQVVLVYQIFLLHLACRACLEVLVFLVAPVHLKSTSYLSVTSPEKLKS